MWGADSGGGLIVSQLCINRETDKPGVFHGWFREYYNGVKMDQYDVLGRYDNETSEKGLTMGW